MESIPSSSNQGYGPWSQSTSFEDKLIGVIPGAYTQAFSFGDLMEDDMDFDD